MEHYTFDWYGKKEAKAYASTPCDKALKQDAKRSLNEQKAQHLIIEGDNADALKLLQKDYSEKIKCIYIDPPYNTGQDFVYSDNFTQDLKAYQSENKTKDSRGRYHTQWLSMLYPRLILAKQLLRQDGAIFVSIDDNEVHHLRKLMDTVFGEENFRNIFIIRRHDKNLNRQFMHKGLLSYNVGFEYIICYAKSSKFTFNPIFKAHPDGKKKKGYWKGFWNNADRPTMRYDICGFTPETGQWKWSKIRGLKALANYQDYKENHSEKMTLAEYREMKGGKLDFVRRNPKGKGKNKGVEHWVKPSMGMLRNTNWLDMLVSKATKEVKGLFDFPKNPEVIKTVIEASTKADDIVLDFFAGSGSTGQAVLELNAKKERNNTFILVQLPEKLNPKAKSLTAKNAVKLGFETISEITIERCKRVIEGQKLETGFKVLKIE